MLRGSRGGRGRGGQGHNGFSKPYGYQSNINTGHSIQSVPHSNGSGSSQAGFPQAHQSQYGGHGQYSHGFPSSPYPYIRTGNAYQNNSDQNSSYKCPNGLPTQASYASMPMGQGKEHMEKGGPALMDPSTRTGFDIRIPLNSGKPSATPLQNALHQDRGRPAALSHGARDSKQMHGDAFGSVRNPMAPPAVPAFGTQLVGKALGGSESDQKPKKKKRRHNQLGLTPKTEDHESSEEEAVDEESKLAATQSSGPVSALQFTYKGQVATLKSPSDIAAWIAERKKRYPTKKRAEEAAERKEQQKKVTQETKDFRKKEWKKTKASGDKTRIGLDEAAIAKIKAEKLRKQYEKAQRRVEEIEVKSKVREGPVLAGQERASNPNPPVEPRTSIQARELSFNQSTSTYAEPLRPQQLGNPQAEVAPSEGSSLMISMSAEGLPEPREGVAPVPNSMTVASQSLAPASKDDPSHGGISSPGRSSDRLRADLLSILNGKTGLVKELDDSILTDSSDLSSSDDDSYTSSSGSSSEDTSPLEITSKSDGPKGAPHTKSRRSKTICNAFLAKGRCLRGDKCKYRHELPERGSGGLEKNNRKGNGGEHEKPRIESVSLYQRVSDVEFSSSE